MESSFLYRRVRHHITALILDDDYREGDALPSVRSLGSELNANPLTVAKAYQPLLEAGVIKAKRGVGFFIAHGGVQRLQEMERARFLDETWPEFAEQIRRLGITASELAEQGGAETKYEKSKA